MNSCSHPRVKDTTAPPRRPARDNLAGWLSIGAALCLLCDASLRSSRITGVVALLTKVAFRGASPAAARIKPEWSET